MDVVLIILSAVCLFVGLIGCIAPALPGPPISFFGLILLGCTSIIEFSWGMYIFWAFLVVVVTVLDFIVPMWGTKKFKGSKWGERGSLVGTILGFFLMPWGILIGPFLGAVVGELMCGRTSGDALKSGIGSLLGFLFGTTIKFVVCGYFIWQFFVAVF